MKQRNIPLYIPTSTYITSYTQVPVYPLDYRSSFLCSTLVNPGAGPGGCRPPGMWRSSSRPPGEVAASGLGASPGLTPGLASHTATARSPGRQPFWPTQSHLLHPMALQWPERAKRALSTPNPKTSYTTEQWAEERPLWHSTANISQLTPLSVLHQVN